jgi:hypothetical protein
MTAPGRSIHHDRNRVVLPYIANRRVDHCEGDPAAAIDHLKQVRPA